MRGETGFHAESAEQASPEILKQPEKSEHRKIRPELAAAILAAFVAVCPGCKKFQNEPTIIPGNTEIEEDEYEEGEELKMERLYDILLGEIPVDKHEAFDKILEEEGKTYFVKKFGFRKEDVLKYFRNFESAKRRGLIEKYCEKNGVPVELARAVAANESGGRKGAVSSRGARGIFQVMPKTAASHGVKENLHGEENNIIAGTSELRRGAAKFGQWGLDLISYAGGSGDLAELLIKLGYLERGNKFKSGGKHFKEEPDNFYKEGRVPNIVDLYLQRPDKGSVGYAFRVASMAQVMEAVKIDDNGQLVIDEKKLPLSDYWDSAKGENAVKEVKAREREKKKKKKPASKYNIKPQLPVSQVNTKKPIWASRR